MTHVGICNLVLNRLFSCAPDRSLPTGMRKAVRKKELASWASGEGMSKEREQTHMLRHSSE